MTLDKLINKFINGDASAFDKIYKLTQKSVYYVAISILHDVSLAEDVMQSTYMSVLKNILLISKKNDKDIGKLIDKK